MQQRRTTRSGEEVLLQSRSQNFGLFLMHHMTGLPDRLKSEPGKTGLTLGDFGF